MIDSFETTGETVLLERSDVICSDAANRCEDCPCSNPNPPSDSDCPYFEAIAGVPFCTKEDASKRQLNPGGPSTGIGNTALDGFVD